MPPVGFIPQNIIDCSRAAPLEALQAVIMANTLNPVLLDHGNIVHWHSTKLFPVKGSSKMLRVTNLCKNAATIESISLIHALAINPVEHPPGMLAHPTNYLSAFLMICAQPLPEDSHICESSRPFLWDYAIA